MDMTPNHGENVTGWIASAPKVLLHDHLDGGVRPATIIDLAAEVGYEGLPTSDPDELARYLQDGANRKDLGLYLEMFDHTVAVMRSPAALARVAREAVQDYRRDGIVYAEVRFAPTLLVTDDFGLEEIVETTLGAIADEVASDPAPIEVGLILDAMRNQPGAEPIVDLASRYIDQGVVGFDIAGPELGFPATDHLAAFRRCQDLGVPYTIHAGEGAGVESVRGAVVDCGAQRLGHGVRLVEDRTGDSWGALAQQVIDTGIPLEVCPSSNVDTGIAHTVEEHPIDLLRRSGFVVTVNTDNRTMSGITLSQEWQRCVDAFDWTPAVVEELTRNALGCVFGDGSSAARIDRELVTPYFADLDAAAS